MCFFFNDAWERHEGSYELWRITEMPRILRQLLKSHCAPPCSERSEGKGSKFGGGYSIRISVTLPATLLTFRSFSLGVSGKFQDSDTSQPPPSIKRCTLDFGKTCEVEEMSLGDLLIYGIPSKCPDGTLKEAAVASFQVFILVLYIQRCKRLSWSRVVKYPND
jgi:hypothetical protein